MLCCHLAPSVLGFILNYVFPFDPYSYMQIYFYIHHIQSNSDYIKISLFNTLKEDVCAVPTFFWCIQGCNDHHFTHLLETFVKISLEQLPRREAAGTFNLTPCCSVSLQKVVIIHSPTREVDAFLFPHILISREDK